MGLLRRTITRHITMPLWAMRNYPRVFRYLREYEHTQFWSPDRVRELQWQRLRKIIRIAYDRCPYYTCKFRQVGFSPDDLREPSDLLKIPVLTKEDIRQNQANLTVRGIAPGGYEDNFTGGSTGSPISFKVSKRRWASRHAISLRHDQWCGWRMGEVRGFLWGNPNDNADDSLYSRFRYAVLDPRVLLNTFDVQEPSFGQFLDELRRKKVRYLVGYSRSLLLFAEYLSQRRIEPSPLRAAVTTAECLSPEERDFIQRTLHCPTFDRYGCREFSVIASECEAHRGLHLAAEALLVEFVVGNRYAGPGEVGEILVTDLLNDAMPLIRYQIGDMGTPIEGSCFCGRGLPRMEMLAGRVTDFIHTPNGRWISGVAINTYLISQLPGVSQAQIIQQQCDHLRFRLIASEQSTQAAENFLHEQVPKMFGAQMGHSIEWTTRIPPEASGKTRVTISACAQTHGFASPSRAVEGKETTQSAVSP